MSIPLPPLPEPVAYLVEGWHDGKLIAHISHLTLDDAKSSAAVFSQHYTMTKTTPLYAAPPAAPATAAPVVQEPMTWQAEASLTDVAMFCRKEYAEVNAYRRGLRDAELYHGITGGGK